MLSNEKLRQFRDDLVGWYQVYRRDLPWRRTRDPYAIWISETMLQQTRVAAVVPYYERFLKHFPDAGALAAAPEALLLASWAGLGYYYRVRNLQKAARLITDSGTFPASYDTLRELPGVGDYTAAAVASIAFDLPHAVVDGNVLRVLSRLFADATNIASSSGKKNFATQAQALLDRDHPGAYNQAIMELGATVCLPQKPLCLVCPVSAACKARAEGQQDRFPVKIASKKSVEEERTLFWIERGRKILLWQRPPDSRLMPGFWELPERQQLPHATAGHTLGCFRHGITFHSYRFSVVEASVSDDIRPCQWIPVASLASLPVSTILRKARRVVDSAVPDAFATDGSAR